MANGETRKTGSANYLAAADRGFVEGEGRYVASEPHHGQDESGGWYYTSMHHAAADRAWTLLMDGAVTTVEGTETAPLSLVVKRVHVETFTNTPKSIRQTDPANFLSLAKPIRVPSHVVVFGNDEIVSTTKGSWVIDGVTYRYRVEELNCTAERR